MTDSDIYLKFSAQFRAIDDNLDDLMNRAENFQQASQIMESWKQSNLNMMTARNKLFINHLDQIKEILDDFANASDSMEKSLIDLQKAATTINKVAGLITLAVSKGTELQKKV